MIFTVDYADYSVVKISVLMEETLLLGVVVPSSLLAGLLFSWLLTLLLSVLCRLLATAVLLRLNDFMLFIVSLRSTSLY